MKGVFIYTGAILIPVVSAKVKKAIPNCEIINILDDSIVQDCIKLGGINEFTRSKLCKLYQYAYDLGADFIVNTCSSVGETIELAKQIVPIPVYRIDEPMAETAISKGKRIGVLATLQSTLEPTCRLLESKSNGSVTIVRGLADGAYQAAAAGDTEEHDNKISQTAKTISSQCDVIVLAQGSMARMEDRLRSEVDIPVLSSPDLFVEYLKSTLM